MNDWPAIIEYLRLLNALRWRPYWRVVDLYAETIHMGPDE